MATSSRAASRKSTARKPAAKKAASASVRKKTAAGTRPVKAAPVKTAKTSKVGKTTKAAKVAKVGKPMKPVAKPASPKPQRTAATPSAATEAPVQELLLKPAPVIETAAQPEPEFEAEQTLIYQSVTLKYCFHGQHSKPESTFRILPGTKQKRRVCSECYTKIMADRRSKLRSRVG